MKKQLKLTILTLVLGLMSLTTVNAQSFKKSEKFLEGSVSYTKATDISATYSLKPTVGYFVTDKVAVGVFGEVGESATEKTTGIGAFARCYFMNLGQHAKVYSQLDLGTNSVDVASVKTSTVSANLSLGANYFVTSKLALTMSLANLISYESADSKSTMSVGFAGVANPFATTGFGVLYKF
jgi:outer membrane protein